MKKILFSLNLALFFLLFFHSTVLAQTLNIAQTSVTLGQNVDISADIPNINKADYHITVMLSSTKPTSATGQFTVGMYIINGKCTFIEVAPPWKSKGEPTCSVNGPSFVFSGILDSSKIFAGISPTTDLEYSVRLIGNADKRTDIIKTFIVKASKESKATFVIESVTPNPLRRGELVSINLSNTIAGDYLYGIIGENPTFGKCPQGNCTLTFKLPLNASTADANIIVTDPNNERRNIAVSIFQPTVTPTPTPPPPPCEKKGGLDKDGKSTTVRADIVSCSEIDTALGPINTKPEEFVKSIFGILLSLAGGVALVLIMISGYRLMFSQGNPEKVQAAREQLTSAIVGLLFVIFSITILQIIGVDILKIPGFSR